MTWEDDRHREQLRRSVLMRAERVLHLLDVEENNDSDDCNLRPQVERAERALDRAVRELAAVLEPVDPPVAGALG